VTAAAIADISHATELDRVTSCRVWRTLASPKVGGALNLVARPKPACIQISQSSRGATRGLPHHPLMNRRPEGTPQPRSLSQQSRLQRNYPLLKSWQVLLTLPSTMRGRPLNRRAYSTAARIPISHYPFQEFKASKTHHGPSHPFQHSSMNDAQMHTWNELSFDNSTLLGS
jgi:hypothetical protein